MKKLYIAACMMALTYTCQAQNFTPDQRERITNFFYKTGYQYLQMAHITCTAKRINVTFGDDDKTVIVDLTFEDLFSSQFTCHYYLTYANGTFTYLQWACGSNDFHCWRGCDLSRQTIIAMMREYQRRHPQPDQDSDQVWRELQQMFNEKLENITCSEFCLGFILLEWYDYKG